MSRIDLAELSNLQNESSAVSTINVNSEDLEAILDNALFRNGEAPNHMLAQLDMNSNKIINLPAAVDPTDPVRVQDLPNLVPDIGDIQIDLDALDQAVTDAEQAAEDAQAAADSLDVGTIAVQDANAVAISGGNISNTLISNVPGPQVAGDISNKQYADKQNPENARVLVRVATTTTLPNSPTYTAATSTTTAILEATTNGSLTIDGVTVSDGDRVMVKDQATALHNDVYTKSTVASHWKLTGVADVDAALKGEAFYVNEGSTNGGKSFTRTDTTPNYYGDTVFVFTSDDFVTQGQLDVVNKNIALNASNITTLLSTPVPFPTTTTLGGVKSSNTVSNQFLTGLGTDGVLTRAQPSASDVSGLAASATTDATNAANILSGILPDARLPNIISAGGPIGDTSHVPTITWDAHGRLTAVSSTAISAGGGITIGIVAPGVNSVDGLGTNPDQGNIAGVISGSGIITFYPGLYRLTADTNWPANKVYIFHPGAVIKVDSGKTLTIDGAVNAGAYKIFGNTTSAGFDLIGTVSRVKSVRPEWWGAKRDGSTNDAPAINAAIACAQAYTTSSYPSELEMVFSAGAYVISSTIKFTVGGDILGLDYHWHIHGVGATERSSGATQIISNSSVSGSAVEIDGTGRNTPVVHMHDIFIFNSSYTTGPAFGLYIHDCGGGYKPCEIHDIVVLNYDRGIQFESSRQFNFTNVTTWNEENDAGGGTGPIGVWMTAGASKFVGDSEFFQCQFVCGDRLLVKGAANNGGGLIRIQVGSTAALTTGGLVTIANVLGTTEANGTWTMTVIDGTHFDLQGSSFVHAYTSGGTADSNTSMGRGVAISITANDSHGSGIKFHGCNFYYGRTPLDIVAAGTNCNVDDIWVNPGNQFESHDLGNSNTISLSAAGASAKIDDVQVRGCYMVGQGYNKNFVSAVSGGGTIFAIHFQDNFCNNTWREGVDIRGTGGFTYGVIVTGNNWRGVSADGGLHNAIYIENVDHIVVNNNLLSGGIFTVDHMVYFNSGGVWQVAVGNNSAGKYATSPVASSSVRSGQLFAGLNT